MKRAFEPALHGELYNVLFRAKRHVLTLALHPVEFVIWKFITVQNMSQLFLFECIWKKLQQHWTANNFRRRFFQLYSFSIMTGSAQVHLEMQRSEQWDQTTFEHFVAKNAV